MDEITETRLKILEQEILDMRERIAALERKTPKSNVVLSGTPRHVQQYIQEKKKEVSNK